MGLMADGNRNSASVESSLGNLSHAWSNQQPRGHLVVGLAGGSVGPRLVLGVQNGGQTLVLALRPSV